MKRRFCVISPVATNRTWTEDIEEAIQHASGMIKGDTRVMYVVQVVKVVKLAHPPVEAIDPADYHGGGQ